MFSASPLQALGLMGDWLKPRLFLKSSGRGDPLVALVCGDRRVVLNFGDRSVAATIKFHPLKSEADTNVGFTASPGKDSGR
jgi:hypothetical protein